MKPDKGLCMFFCVLFFGLDRAQNTMKYLLLTEELTNRNALIA